jgi:hypothetical protein
MKNFKANHTKLSSVTNILKNLFKKNGKIYGNRNNALLKVRHQHVFKYSLHERYLD